MSGTSHVQNLEICFAPPRITAPVSIARTNPIPFAGIAANSVTAVVIDEAYTPQPIPSDTKMTARAKSTAAPF